MTHSELHRTWARTEACLRAAKQALPTSLAEVHATDLAQVEEFLSHNELGLAADCLTEIATVNPSDALATIKALILAEENMGRAREQQKLEYMRRLVDLSGHSNQTHLD
jgi:hypothetical protein